MSLPLITFDTETLNPGTNIWLSTSNAVRQALEDYGCFVVSTNKVPLGLRLNMFELSKDLFDLPTETKIKNTSHILGFGYGQYPSLPLYECLGIENGATMEAIQSLTDLLFPCGNNAFCECALEYMKLLSEIHLCMMRMVLDSYGITEDNEQFENGSLYLARFMKYRAPIVGEAEIALPPHLDKSFLGILDDNGVKGFEVRMKNGEWIHHEPPSPSSTFIVVAGEPLMAWSNGRINAPLHQVAMRTSTKEVVRYSTGLFLFMKETIQVPEKLVDNEHHLRFGPFNNMDFLKYASTKEGMSSKCAIKSYCGVITESDTTNGNKHI
uniref:probable inactive 2-oxoglutarate-dependent dioxygenase AOP2 n=1 Tax=Erigeron canadensis TaxID=72917 RepID=UPI001CB8D474|nr:probable inactive 2-oxoglutarate-dependent dioxygenase AOP2 [Erigeron canadensis]